MKTLKKKIEFENIFSKGKRFGSKYFIFYFKEKDSIFSKFGMVLKKKFGNSVKRNRMRRMIRQTFRENENAIRGGIDIIVLTKIIDDTLFSNMKYIDVKKDIVYSLKKHGLLREIESLKESENS